MSTPHAPPGLPVVGNAPRFGEDPLRFLEGVQQAYGEQYSFVSFGNAVDQTALVVTDAEVVETVLDDRVRFEKPDFRPQRREMLTGRGLLTSEGDLWETQRETLQPLFMGQLLREYADVVSGAVDDLLAEWPADGTVDLMTEMTVLTLRVISRALFSHDVSRDEAIEIQEAMDVLGREVEPSAVDAVRPSWFPDAPSDAYDEATDTIEAFAREVIDSHRQAETPPDDFVTTLLKAEANPDVDLHERELRDEVVTFLTAGHETTALTLLYAFDWLSNHPGERSTVRSEAEAAVPATDASSAWDALADLDHTERVVMETLRLTPPVWNTFRTPTGPVRLEGHGIEAGTTLLLPQWAHHRDPAVWEAPSEFRPDRWTDRSRKTPSYFPFGYGPRICIGRPLALIEARIALAKVFYHYDVQVDSDAFGFRPGVTLQPDGSVPARVTTR